MLITTNIWELYWTSQMTKTFRDNCGKSIVQQTSCEPLFPDVQTLNAVKNVLCRSFCTPIYASQLWWNFRKPCMQKLRMAFIILDAELDTTCPGEWVLVVMTHQVQCNIPTFEALLRKICTCFSKDAEDLITYGCLLWRSQIVYIRPYSLNTTTAFYFVTEYSDIAVFVRLRVCMSQCIRTLPGFDQFRN